jgi:hypothetical protein
MALYQRRHMEALYTEFHRNLSNMESMGWNVPFYIGLSMKVTAEFYEIQTYWTSFWKSSNNKIHEIQENRKGVHITWQTCVQIDVTSTLGDVSSHRRDR